MELDEMRQALQRAEAAAAEAQRQQRQLELALAAAQQPLQPQHVSEDGHLAAHAAGAAAAAARVNGGDADEAPRQFSVSLVKQTVEERRPLTSEDSPAAVTAALRAALSKRNPERPFR
ncbi:unnamed protein product, partial [Phaeothamnion confervicola]